MAALNAEMEAAAELARLRRKIAWHNDEAQHHQAEARRLTNVLANAEEVLRETPTATAM